jgi:hypothetical protein
MALRGKVEWTNNEETSEFSESYFTLGKHKRHRKGVSVQKSEDFKTLMLMLLGEITFVIGLDCIFVNLRGACDSSVLQCVPLLLPSHSAHSPPKLLQTQSTSSLAEGWTWMVYTKKVLEQPNM